MRAIVVRDRQTQQLIAFGPENGMYQPTHDSRTSTVGVEPDYDAVCEEWRLARPPVKTRKERALIDPRVPDWFKEWVDDER